MSDTTIDENCVLVSETRWPDLPNELFRILLRHWAQLRGNALVAPRAAIDASVIARCLPFVSLFRFDRSNGDFICTLSGEANSSAWGASLAGKRHAEFMDPESAETLVRRARVMVATPAIAVGHSLLGRRGESIKRKLAGRLSLPLSDSDGAPWGLISITCFGPSASGQGRAKATNPSSVLFDCRALPRIDP